MSWPVLLLSPSFSFDYTKVQPKHIEISKTGSERMTTANICREKRYRPRKSCCCTKRDLIPVILGRYTERKASLVMKGKNKLLHSTQRSKAWVERSVICNMEYVEMISLGTTIRRQRHYAAQTLYLQMHLALNIRSEISAHDMLTQTAGIPKTPQDRLSRSRLSSAVPTTTTFPPAKQPSSITLIQLLVRGKIWARYPSSHPTADSSPVTSAFAIFGQDRLVKITLTEYQELYPYCRVQCQNASSPKPERRCQNHPCSPITAF